MHSLPYLTQEATCAVMVPSHGDLHAIMGAAVCDGSDNGGNYHMRAAIEALRGGRDGAKHQHLYSNAAKDAYRT